MSAINGAGWGSDHNWVYLHTHADDYSKGTSYRCGVCGARFMHYYDVEPDIFAAMQRAGVSDKCANVGAA
jgi:hypothetical protein